LILNFDAAVVIGCKYSIVLLILYLHGLIHNMPALSLPRYRWCRIKWLQWFIMHIQWMRWINTY